MTLAEALAALQAIRQVNKAVAQAMRAFTVYHAKDLEQVQRWADRLDSQ